MPLSVSAAAKQMVDLAQNRDGRRADQAGAADNDDLHVDSSLFCGGSLRNHQLLFPVLAKTEQLSHLWHHSLAMNL